MAEPVSILMLMGPMAALVGYLVFARLRRGRDRTPAEPGTDG
ncbi:hypothetical protein [Phenylobacterium sp.]|nr:hypothetical protein [Phenylobacterium sp.]HVI34107.1 hypothetical protein [Phenylobacterium sp.]